MNAILTRLSAELIRKYEAEGFWRRETIYALMSGHAQRAPNSFAVRDRFRRITYRQLLEAADALTADLAAHGVRAGQRIGVWLPSRIESVVALLACSKCGAICCPSLHRDHTVADVIELMQRTYATAFIWQSGYGADADKHDFIAPLKKVPTIRHVYRLEPLTENSASWPGLSRPSTRVLVCGAKNVDARVKPGHDE
jgi:non-ribosomal peptide synthetase component E (peptide arylation enzyme)